MRLSTVLASFAVLICASGHAHAYLDPGTGSIILQAIVATVASSLFVIKIYWYKLKALFGVSRNAADTEDESDSAQ